MFHKREQAQRQFTKLNSGANLFSKLTNPTLGSHNWDNQHNQPTNGLEKRGKI